MNNGVVFFEHIDFQGRSWTFDDDQPFVGGEANDQFSSVRVPAGASVTLFEHRDFGGRSLTLTADASDLRTGGWNDAVSSLKFSGGGAGKAERLLKGSLFVECDGAGNISFASSARDESKVAITKHDNLRWDATFIKAQRTLSIEPDGGLSSRPPGTFGGFEALAAATQPKPDVVTFLYRSNDGVVCGGTVLQIVEE